MPDAEPARALAREELRSALDDLVARLDDEGIETSIYLVGGAALALVDHVRDSTRDIDALYSPVEPVERIASEVARARGLPRAWFNNKAQGYVSHVRDDPAPRPFVTIGCVSVTAASHEVLLAMKIRASRGRIDREDMEFLLPAVGITTKQAALELYDLYYPEDPLTVRAEPTIESALIRIAEVQGSSCAPGTATQGPQRPPPLSGGVRRRTRSPRL